MVPLERSINIYLNLCADICCWTSIFKSLQVTFKSTFRIHVFFLLCTSCCHCSLACQVCKNRQEREAKHYSFIHRWFVNLWVPPFAGESSWEMCTCLCLTARSSWGKKKSKPVRWLPQGQLLSWLLPVSFPALALPAYKVCRVQGHWSQPREWES